MSGQEKKLFIITGMSGAGKSQALKSFEDFGFYCVDNLPLALLPAFAELMKSRRDPGGIALGIDVREGKAIKNALMVIEAIRKTGVKVSIVFLDASDSTLIHRFSETRHRHPLGKNLQTAIRQERALLSGLKVLADKDLDTSDMTLGELKENLSRLLDITRSGEMMISVMSFGFKYGIPLDADLVMDVRFLANPNYITELKKKTGLDRDVAEYIERDRNTAEFLKKYSMLVKHLVPLYMREGKSYLTIAIGCTGGRHRSVYIAHTIAEALRSMNLSVDEYHRDMKR